MRAPVRLPRRLDAAQPAADATPPSKTRRKKDMHALQVLGAALVDIDPAQLKALALPERLLDAIVQARTITKHEARRRQLQFVGRLMRDVDAEPIRAALNRMQSVSHAQRAQFAASERWRDRLLDDALAVAEFIAEYPRADAAGLATLVGAARSERARGGPPHKSRALFRALSRYIVVDDGTANER